MTKKLCNSNYKHTKIYLCSRNVERPALLVQDRTLKLLNQLNIHDKNEVLSNNYSNDS